MKIQCPRCKQQVPAAQVNVAADVAFCPPCNEGFRLSDCLDASVISPDILRSPPDGAWYRKEFDHVVVGATTRSPVAFFLVPFMCVWSGFSLSGIYGTQLVKGEFSLEQSLFGLPFVLGSVIFWSFALMAVAGKVEVSIGKTSSIFVGVGNLGWRRPLQWREVKVIREVATATNYPGSSRSAILLEGRESLKIGSGLNDTRRVFVMNALKYLKSQER